MDRPMYHHNVYHLPRRKRTAFQKRLLLCPNLVLFILVCFVVVSGIQAVQVNRLLTDTRALSADVAQVKAERQAILERYALQIE